MGGYKIQSGDSWWKIANANGMTVEELKALNPGVKMHPGQTLLLQKSSQPTPKTKQSTINKFLGLSKFVNGFEYSNVWENTQKIIVDKHNAKVDSEIADIQKLSKDERKEIQRWIMQELGDDALGKYRDDGDFGKLSQAKYRELRSAGKIFEKKPVKVAQPLNTVISNIQNSMTSGIYDNIYPYSYGDVDRGNGVYTQATANDSALTQITAATDKFFNATQEMDPRRAIMNEMAALDLNTPEGLAKWTELAQKADGLEKKMIRYRGTTPQQIRNQQWEMRARLDAMNLYQGRPQQWNTYIEQEDESKRSARATNAGKPTLIINDQAQRNRINGELLNYWNANPDKRIKGDDGLYRLPVMSYLGNATIVQQADGSLRYADDWDYTWTSKNDPNRPYFGEVLTDFSGKGYGTGVNGRAMHEGMTELGERLVNEEVKPRIEVAKNQAKDWLAGITGNLVNYFKV